MTHVFNSQDGCRTYTLRPTVPEDLPLATAWTEADPDHRLTTKPEFWLETGAHVESKLLLWMDEPVFFFKLERVRVLRDYYTGAAPNRGLLQGMELHIQFKPGPRNSTTMLALMDGMAWLEKRLQTLGVEAVYFTTKQKSLAAFAGGRLGFDFITPVDESGNQRLRRLIARAA